jgi:hypothetical protein
MDLGSLKRHCHRKVFMLQHWRVSCFLYKLRLEIYLENINYRQAYVAQSLEEGIHSMPFVSWLKVMYPYGMEKTAKW